MSTAAWAERYIERFGLALTWLAPGQKKPTHDGWNLPGKLIRTPQLAREHWTRHPQDGIGAQLEQSDLVSLDCDNVERTSLVLAKFGINLDGLRAGSATVVGNPVRCRLMFQAPTDTALARKTLRWPRQEDTSKHDVVFELRAGAIQDVLPPTIHPSTGRPYTWETPPRVSFSFLPASLISLWTDWDATEDIGQRACPWYVAPQPTPRSQRSRPRDPSQPSVIAEFNAAHDVAAILQTYGYKRQGKRFLSPSSSTRVAGVVVLESGRAYFHNESDALADGRAHDAFDVYAHLEHGGDVRRAVRTAAELLGLGGGARAA